MVATTVLLAATLTIFAASTAAAPLKPRAPSLVQIHPGGNPSLCLTADQDYRSRKAVTLQNCDCSNLLQNWLMTPGMTRVAMASDTNFVLSGAINPLRGWFPGNGKQLETWSLDSSAKDGASVWNYKNGKFHTTGKNSVIPPQPANFCLDNTDGKLTPGNTVQYWDCYEGNGNQQWTTTPNLSA